MFFWRPKKGVVRHKKNMSYDSLCTHLAHNVKRHATSLAWHASGRSTLSGSEAKRTNRISTSNAIRKWGEANRYGDAWCQTTCHVFCVSPFPTSSAIRKWEETFFFTTRKPLKEKPSELPSRKRFRVWNESFRRIFRWRTHPLRWTLDWWSTRVHLLKIILREVCRACGVHSKLKRDLKK